MKIMKKYVPDETLSVPIWKNCFLWGFVEVNIRMEPETRDFHLC